ncbi:MAG: hypothetical protein PF448_01030 [Bacteroidales bacterium]|jgi:hypothetical protein|nr:hypothetical protein [Bacteroidales bacterium]
MKKAEIIIGSLAILSLGINLLAPSIGRIMALITLLTLSSIYFYLSFALFNGIRLRKVLKKGSYKGIGALRIIGAIGAGSALSITLVGMAFKIELLPGGNFEIMIGLILLSIIGIIAVIKLIQTKSSFYKNIMLRIVIFGILGLLLFLTPSNQLIDIKFRNHPSYAEALKKAIADPQNTALWDIVKEEEQKMKKLN